MVTKMFVDKSGDKKVRRQRVAEVNERLMPSPARKFDGDFWG
jgi:hypothetical protein